MTLGVESLCEIGLPPALANDIAGAADNITATASGTQATSAIVTSYITRIGTVATSGDGVGIPYARIGASFVISNGSALKAITVFPQGSDTINGIAGATGFTLPGGRTVLFLAPAAAKWVAILSA